ncbi:hypothetical protein J7E73_19600 [Paenibacillus albidus]|uniref:hypothetical protein n=1 Tax=Paenibacillus albidus TaxID=2041023 RepID=UPI001BE61C4C|nr:hypothetical protein [Paenibacillus albidus]MBT2291284.1 hypothetical protein [Paenibacillus albidus]
MEIIKGSTSDRMVEPLAAPLQSLTVQRVLFRSYEWLEMDGQSGYMENRSS